MFASPECTSHRIARLCASRFWRIVAVSLLLMTAFAAQLGAPSYAHALALGKGKYELTGSVFGTDLDGLVGEETSNGRRVRPFDRMVALPACTESSCPWLSLNSGPDDEFGAQTACAESDGLCWVQIISPETGICAVAPVIDRGPLFVRDNWWGLKSERTYRYNRGIPAAEIALQGVDLGFGEGMSDSGFDIANDYTYASAIDLGAGTWVDLGLDPDQGVADLQVKLLWQADINHESACGGSYGNAETSDSVNLRGGPSTDDDIITVLEEGQRLSIAGVSQNDFYLVDVNGARGWVFKEYLKPDDGKVGDDIGFVTDEVNFRAGPSTSDDVYQVVPEGSVTVVTGSEKNGFIPVVFRDQAGWISSDYLDLGNTSGENPGGGGGGDGVTAVTTDSVNFRSGPSLSDTVIKVLSPGTEVIMNDDEQNGFMSVTYGGFDGWIFSEYLMVEDGDGGDGGDETMKVSENLNLRDGPSTSDTVLVVMPAGATVTVTGDAVNGFLPVTYKNREGWAFAQYLE